jgi:pimeloyl-ACP methyl ester carboxylesterase
MTTLVLLHGGGGGAWMWKDLEAALRKLGHEVHKVTFSGFGERRHLLSAQSNIETHVTDVVNELELNDIQDATLIAHSYSGAVAPGVAAIASSRLRAVIYLDALIVHQNETVAHAMGMMSEEQAHNSLLSLLSGASALTVPTADQMRSEAARKPFRMSAQRQQWLLSHLTNMPLAATVTPAAVGAESMGLPVDYLAATETLMRPIMHPRARALGWRLREIEGDHLFPIGDPEATAQQLHGLVQPRSV